MSLFTVSWVLVLFGLPALFATQRGAMGRRGLVGSLGAFRVVTVRLHPASRRRGFPVPVRARWK
jgi:hypothetical protein